MMCMAASPSSWPPTWCLLWATFSMDSLAPSSCYLWPGFLMVCIYNTCGQDSQWYVYVYIYTIVHGSKSSVTMAKSTSPYFPSFIFPPFPPSLCLCLPSSFSSLLPPSPSLPSTPPPLLSPSLPSSQVS